MAKVCAACRAYVEARYDMGYKITKEELEYLSARVKKLQSVTVGMLYQDYFRERVK